MALKISKQRPRALERERRQWMDGLLETRLDLENARVRFNHATQPELIEQCVYEINALMARQAYFWRVIREKYPEGCDGL